jgi:hypothetical protein
MGEALLRGDVVGALSLNPLVFAGLSAVAAWAAVSAARVVFGLPCYRLTLTAREQTLVRLLAWSAIAAGWAYLIRAGV